MKNLINILFLVMLLFSFSSCSVVADIFKAGMGFGIFIVVVIVVIIVWLISRGRK